MESEDAFGTGVRHRGRVPFFDGAGGKVFYRHWRARTGRITGSIVLLHGWGQHSGDYHAFVRLLTSRGFAVWALDHVGHGMTEGEPGCIGPVDDLVENARRLAALVAREPGCPGRPLVLGHSMGAVVAAGLTVAAPDACSAVVLSGVPFGDAGGRGRSRGRPDDSESSARAAAFERVRRGFAGGVAVPVLVLHGGDDAMVPVAGVRAEFEGRAGVRMVVFDDAGHDLPHEPVSERVAEEIASFSAAVRGGARGAR